MRVNTVLLPLKAMQFNPRTGQQELTPTGMLQEYAGNTPVGQPIPQPQYAQVHPGGAGLPASALRPQTGYAKAVISSPPADPQADYWRGYNIPGETPEQTYMRNEANVARMQIVPGTNRAVAT